MTTKKELKALKKFVYDMYDIEVQGRKDIDKTIKEIRKQKKVH